MRVGAIISGFTILSIIILIDYTQGSVRCNDCEGESCMNKGTCEGDFCFVTSIFRNRHVKGCGENDAPVTDKVDDLCVIGRESNGKPEPLFCQCKDDGCNKQDFIIIDKPSLEPDTNVVDGLETVSPRTCLCYGSHCDVDSVYPNRYLPCQGLYCWELTFNDTYDTFKGCTDQVGLINGRFCASPPAGIFTVGIKQLDLSTACYCNDEDYCNDDLDKPDQMPNGKLEVELELHTLKQSSISNVFLQKGRPHITETVLVGKNYKMKIKYSHFDEKDLEKHELIGAKLNGEVDTTTVAEILEKSKVTLSENTIESSKSAKTDDNTGRSSSKDTPETSANKAGEISGAKKDDGSASSAMVAIIVIVIIVIIVVGIAWKFELHKRLFPAKYHSVAETA